MCKIDLLLWVWHSAETARETSDLVRFPKSGFPVPISFVKRRQLVIWFDFWMAQRDVSTKIQRKVGIRCLNLFWM